MSNLRALLIAIATITAIYAVAATAAKSVAGTFTATESTNRVRRVEFTDATRRLWEVHKAAREKCELLDGASRKACNAEARTQERKGFRIARQL